MNEKREIYKPKRRKPTLLRAGSLLFCVCTALMWVLKDKMGMEKGDLLIMTGIAILLLTLTWSGARAEKKVEADSELIDRIREETGKGDWGSDIFYDKNNRDK